MSAGPAGVGHALSSPLASWFTDEAAVARFRRRGLGRRPVIIPPREASWRAIAPDFQGAVTLAGSGLPFQIAADRRYDRSGDPSRLGPALAAGQTVFLPQVHQVLPRLMRLMVALRAAFLGPFREECSFLFLVDGTGRPGMGLHHDGAVDSFWLQLEGRRTVTVGPPVPVGAPPDLDRRLAAGGRRRRFSTRDLTPGALFYIPPWTPHEVVCRGRSLALSLTWRVRRRAAAAAWPPRVASWREATGLTAWDVVSGYALAVPRPSRDRLWTQVPVVAGPVDRRRRALLVWTPGSGTLWLPATGRPLLRQLVRMPRLRRRDAGRLLPRLLAAGIVGPRDLPQVINPDDPATLDGWRFA